MTQWFSSISQAWWTFSIEPMSARMYFEKIFIENRYTNNHVGTVSLVYCLTVLDMVSDSSEHARYKWPFRPKLLKHCLNLSKRSDIKVGFEYDYLWLKTDESLFYRKKVTMKMMMMNCSSQISDTPREEFEHAQNLSSSLAEWSWMCNSDNH